MTNTLNRLQWDSDFFGYPIAKVYAESVSTERLLELMNDARADGIKLIYLFTDPADADSKLAASQVKARLVDEKVTFHIDLDEEMPAQTDVHIKDFDGAQPSERLVNLSMQSGLYSRYKVDPGFQNNEFEKLYLKWIENSVNRSIADNTLVYVDGNTELGFVTLKVKDDCGEIGLIAVDESSRGRSIGKKLVHAVIDVLLSKGIYCLDVATQLNNEEACNFYRKVGFSVSKSERIYHIWL